MDKNRLINKQNNKIIFNLFFSVYFFSYSNYSTAFHEFDSDYDVVHVFNAPNSHNEFLPNTDTTKHFTDTYLTIVSKQRKKYTKKNCSSDTYIIDKLLNGTGYNKFRIPGLKFSYVIFFL